MALHEELVSVLGRDAAIRLLTKFGGRTVYLSKLRGNHEGRDIANAVVKEHYRGVKMGDIAVNHCLEVSTVIDILECSLTFDLR